MKLEQTTKRYLLWTRKRKLHIFNFKLQRAFFPKFNSNCSIDAKAIEFLCFSIFSKTNKEDLKLELLERQSNGPD